jgi:quinol monooxygenase YgiN
MKKIVCIIGLVLMISSCCGKKSQNCNETCCVPNKDALELIMNIPVKLKPEYVSAYIKAFDKCQAESLKEEACLAYELFQSYNDSTEFHLYERWTNKPGHQKHMETAHVKLYFQEIAGMQVAAKSKMITTIVCPKLNQ